MKKLIVLMMILLTFNACTASKYPRKAPPRASWDQPYKICDGNEMQAHEAKNRGLIVAIISPLFAFKAFSDNSFLSGAISAGGAISGLSAYLGGSKKLEEAKRCSEYTEYKINNLTGSQSSKTVK